MEYPWITPELLRRLEQFELLARRRSQSSRLGERRSRARGQSVEFADHRNYVAGDDLRYLDWNLYGRLDRLFIKLYEEERELPVRLFLDASESMAFGQPPKFNLTRQIAAAIGYVGLCGFDEISILPFPSEHISPGILGAMKRIRGKSSSLKLFQFLDQLEAKSGADLNQALRNGALQARSKGLAIVISDFLDPNGYETGLQSLVSRGFEVTAIQILAPEEWTPDCSGDLRLVDAELGIEQEVTYGKYRLKAYQETVKRYCQRLKEYCTGRGIHFFHVQSDHPLEQLLLKQLREAQIWA